MTNKAKLDRDFSYSESPSEEFAHEVEVGIVCYFAFIGFFGVWIARRIYINNMTSVAQRLNPVVRPTK